MRLHATGATLSSPPPKFRARRLLAALLLSVPAACAPPSDVAREELPLHSRSAAPAATGSPLAAAAAQSPVDWQPWGAESFAAAAARDLPLLVFVGCAPCHDCLAMLAVSFSDAQVAERLERDFVAVLVDRDEQPEVERWARTAVTLLSGASRLPTVLFVLPDGRPLAGGGPAPPHDSQDQPGLLSVLTAVTQLWEEQREALTERAAALHAALADSSRAASEGATPPSEAADVSALLAESVVTLLGELDGSGGGFWGAPKQPPTEVLRLLLQQAVRTAATVSGHLEVSLDAMSSTSLRDALGDGFFRACLDAEWREPLYEQLLAENSRLALLYAEAAVALQQPRWADVAATTLAWSTRTLQRPDGLHAAGLAADSQPWLSPPPGAPTDTPYPPDLQAAPVAGAVYRWTPAEIEAVLGRREGAAFCAAFGVDGRHADSDGRSLPAPRLTRAALAAQFAEFADDGRDAADWLQDALLRLSAERQRRPQAARDERAFAGFNGLRLSAGARVAALLGDEALAAESVALARSVREKLVVRDAHGRASGVSLFLGESGAQGTGRLFDQAAVALGLLDAHALSGDPADLLDALDLALQLVAQFEDDAQGLWSLPAPLEGLPDRGRDRQDLPLPSGQSLAATLLLRLAPLDSEGRLGRTAAQLLAREATRFAADPSAHAAGLAALELWRAPPDCVLIDGPAPARDEYLEIARRHFPSVALLLPDPARLAAAWSNDSQPGPGADGGRSDRAPAWLQAGRTADTAGARLYDPAAEAFLPCSSPDKLAAALAARALR